MMMTSRPSKTVVLSAILAMMLTAHNDVEAFAPAFVPKQRVRPASIAVSASSLLNEQETPYFADSPVEDKISKNESSSSSATVAKKKPTPPKKAAAGGKHKEGIFSPVVFLSKMLVGEPKINKLRAQIISLHSDVIGNFVNTYETPAGRAILRQLFELADRDRNGTISESELEAALLTLGFDWLKEKQIKGIFERADTDASGAIDMEEWMKEAPKTLRTNLVKLAKKNGGEMGLLV